MDKAIIYKNNDGSVSVIHPSKEAMELYGIEAIAKKDVPTGNRYKIIDSADIPLDRAQRNCWTVEDAELTDGVGS